MAMAVMTQTRVAAVRYGLLAHEFGVWDDATKDDSQIVGYMSSSTQVGTETEFELIRAKARLMVSTINRDLVGASLEAAVGRIYNSIGMDSLPKEVPDHMVSSLAKQLEGNIEGWRKENFSPRAPMPDFPVTIGAMEGMPEEFAKDFRQSIAMIFDLSKVKVAEGPEPRLRVNVTVEVDPPKGGGRQARIQIVLLDASNQSTQYQSEFKTTLSEPVDVEQWKTLGEGAAYRVVGPLVRLQSGRTKLQVGKPQAKTGDLRLFAELHALTGAPSAAVGEFPEFNISLRLRSATELNFAGAQESLRIEVKADEPED